MRIALISYEYPPDTAWGGIGTYAWQAAKAFARMGHEIEIFGGSPERTSCTNEDGVLVHRVKVATRVEFREAIAAVLKRRHAEAPFDVLESPEYCADGAAAAVACPDIPHLVKLHAPTEVVVEYGHPKPGFAKRVRIRLGALRRGKWNESRHRREMDPEYQVTNSAGAIVSPSAALADKIARLWRLERNRIEVIPNPYAPSERLLAMTPSGGKRVLFVGKLTYLKGAMVLLEAARIALAHDPQLRFRLVGRWDGAYRAEVERLWAPVRGAVQCVGAVPLAEIPQALEQCDIALVPSYFENFPNTCLEAMAAARAVVASRVGGLVEMLVDGESGVLVRPGDPRALAAAIVELANDPAKQCRLGEAARRRVLEAYSGERFVAAQVAAYERLIGRMAKARR